MAKKMHPSVILQVCGILCIGHKADQEMITDRLRASNETFDQLIEDGVIVPVAHDPSYYILSDKYQEIYSEMIKLFPYSW